jgi:hypothetical protein
MITEEILPVSKELTANSTLTPEKSEVVKKIIALFGLTESEYNSLP